MWKATAFSVRLWRVRHAILSRVTVMDLGPRGARVHPLVDRALDSAHTLVPTVSLASVTSKANPVTIWTAHQLPLLMTLQPRSSPALHPARSLPLVCLLKMKRRAALELGVNGMQNALLHAAVRHCSELMSSVCRTQPAAAVTLSILQ